MRSFLIAATLGCTVAAASDLYAQATRTDSANTSRWELNVPSGTLVPVGARKDAIKRGGMNAVQLSYVPRRSLAVTATAGWARSRDLTMSGDPKLDVFTYDAGAELRAVRWIEGRGMTFSPFAGAGAGGRSVDHRRLEADATHGLAAYAAAGAELGVRRVRVRLEARDYVARGAAGSDVVVMAGLRFVRR